MLLKQRIRNGYIYLDPEILKLIGISNGSEVFIEIDIEEKYIILRPCLEKNATYLNKVRTNNKTTLGEPSDKSVLYKKILKEISLPPSAKFVLRILVEKGAATFNELVEETGLCKRTIKHALRLLREAGLIKIITCLKDARRRIYTLCYILGDESNT